MGKGTCAGLLANGDTEALEDFLKATRSSSKMVSDFQRRYLTAMKKGGKWEYAKELLFIFAGAAVVAGVNHARRTPQRQRPAKSSRKDQEAYGPEFVDDQPYSRPYSRKKDGPRPSTIHRRGFRPPPGLRSRPPGVPQSWRVKPSKGQGGVIYSDPNNKHNSVRVMPGHPQHKYPNSRRPYVMWHRNGQSLDKNGKVVKKHSPEAHIPLEDFRYTP